ncbi:hypothetical protein L1987_86057 [Smallanthus sonchifolius]|uniref:Uncharacterized protein n=1 Tax=Smallanthus sonchifolius TaxID=185202 RepID=A0ACB8XYA6_9ASTR|nr:hypothetical protein L1987_86057 [Smallanthus sonchifolius]
MFAFSLQFFFGLLFAITTTIAQPYKATDIIFLNCGSSTPSYSNSDLRYWDGDEHSKFLASNINTTSFSSTANHLNASVPPIPYSTARIFTTSSFTYMFPVSRGPKFLRLHFYPTTDTEQSFFSVSCNGYSLLTNFSAFLAASYLANTFSDPGIDEPQVPAFVKEFLIYVKDTQILNITFTPSPNSFAFINGIEIISMPENLYFNAKTPKYLNQYTGPIIDKGTALENIYRLNMGGGDLVVGGDTGMYRSWDKDDDYIYGAAAGLRPVTNKSIMYTMETPNYTAPEEVYQTQRSMGKLSDTYNLTWILPVDSGFYYMIRLHFCNIIPQYNKSGKVVFRIFINNQTAEEKADPFNWTEGSGYPVFKDYIVFVKDTDGRLVRLQSPDKLYDAVGDRSPAQCSRFSLEEMKAATDEFNDNFVIGNGGFEVLCARPVIIAELGDEQASLAEWGKTCYGKGILLDIIDPKLGGEIAPECLRKFGDVASKCLHEEGSERPAMEEVVWRLEFALQLQEDAETMSKNI